MLAILNSLNAHILPIYQPILMILVSKFMVHRALSDITYLLLGLLSPLINLLKGEFLRIKMMINYLMKLKKSSALCSISASKPYSCQKLHCTIL